MPAPVKELTREELEQFKAYIEEKLHGELVCPLCKQDHWDLVQNLVTTPIHTDQGIDISGRTYTYIPLICTNCGYTMLINAVKTGLVDGGTVKTDG